MIEFRHVSKVYENGTHALQDVNIKIESGEFVFIVGASGAGKSTFLKLMMHEEVPTSGSIIVGKQNLGELKPREIPRFRRTMGIVFQDFRLIPNMTVFDNVAFAMRVVGTKENQIRKRVPFVLNLVGLAAKARCYPPELSGGEQQRVALARALANNAELIIADEPTGNVDPQMSMEIVELLSRLNDGGTTVIMVTHEHELVRQFDRRVIILENGCVVHDGLSSKSQRVIKSSQGHLDKGHIDLYEPRLDSPQPETADIEESLENLSEPTFLADETDGVDFTVYLSDDDESPVAESGQEPASKKGRKAEKKAERRKKKGDDVK